MQKISTLAGIIIIVAVAVIAFGGVFAYQYFTKFQTPNSNIQTAGWKTYTNTEYGFEMKYPGNFNQTSAQGKDAMNKSNEFFRATSSTDYLLDSTFIYQFNGESFVPKNIETGYKKSEINIDGIKAYKVEYLGCVVGCGYYNQIFIPYKGGALTISFTKEGSTANESISVDGNGRIVENPQIVSEGRALLDQIIPTFKFTK